jgi:hypothetical protein
MNERLREVLSSAEVDAQWLDEAAQYFEAYASQLNDDERGKWQLLAAVYRERAQLCQISTGPMRGKQVADAKSVLE